MALGIGTAFATQSQGRRFSCALKLELKAQGAVAKTNERIDQSIAE